MIYNTLNQNLAQSQQLLLILAKVKLTEGLAQSNTVNSLLHLMGARAVDLADGALTVSVNDQTKQVRAHVVATEVVESLAEVGLIEVYVDVDKAFEVFCGLGDQALTVGAVDASVAVVHGVVFGGLTRWGLQSNTGGRNCLEGCERERASLDGVSGSDDVGVGVADVSVRVGVFGGRSVRVQRPCGDVDLLALGDGVRLEEGVHVFPAVEVADAANLGIHHHVGGVAGAVTEDETLDVGGADLAAVVDLGAKGLSQQSVLEIARARDLAPKSALLSLPPREEIRALNLHHEIGLHPSFDLRCCRSGRS